jgi:hypothetical protein
MLALDVAADTKWCPSCRRDLPVSAFWLNRGQPDGYQTHCKSCRVRTDGAEAERDVLSTLDPMQRLAAAVIDRAMKDMRGVDLLLYSRKRNSAATRAAKRAELMQAGRDWLASVDAAYCIDVAFTDPQLNDEALTLLDALAREGV